MLSVFVKEGVGYMSEIEKKNLFLFRQVSGIRDGVVMEM